MNRWFCNRFRRGLVLAGYFQALLATPPCGFAAPADDSEQTSVTAGLKAQIQAPLSASDPTAASDRPVALARRRLDAAVKAVNDHMLDQNAYPRSLHQLTTPIAYLSAPPSDPFATSESQRLLTWRPEVSPAPLLYSIGPDRIDQGGAVVYDPTNGSTSSGDIVRTFKSGRALTYREIYGADPGRQIQQDSSIDELIRALESDNLNQWTRATAFLSSRGEQAKSALPLLIRALADERKRDSALDALRGIGPAAAEAIPALMRLLEASSDNQGRGFGPANTLAGIGAAAVPALKEGARPMDNPVDMEIARRLWCSALLVKLGDSDPTYLRNLSDAMQSDRGWVSMIGFEAVQLAGPKAAALAPELAGMLNDSRYPQLQVASALTCIGSPAPAAIPGLIETVATSKDRLVRLQAIRALRTIDRLDAKTAVPVLIEAMKTDDPSSPAFVSLDPQMREEAAGTLEYFGSAARDALPVLLTALHDPNENVRAAAVRAIGRIDPAHPETVSGLSKAMMDKSIRVQYAANGAMLRLGPVNLEAIRAVIRAVRANADQFHVGSVRTGAADQIAFVSEGFLDRLGPEHRDAVPDLADLARDPHPAVQRLAYGALANIGEVPPDLLPHLILRSQENDGSWAGNVLGKLGPKAAPAVPAMLDRLRSGNASQRTMAARILGSIGLPAAKAAVPELSRMAREESENEYTGRTVCEALLKLDPGSAVALDRLEKLAADPNGNPYQRLYLHGLLAERGRNAGAHLRSLEMAINGEDAMAQAVSARLILQVCMDAQLRGEALKKVFQMMDAPNSNLRAQAADGFRAIVPADLDGMPHLVPRLLEIVNQPVKTRGDATRYGLGPAIIGLGRIGPAAREALPSLGKLLDDDEWWIRKIARESIREIEPQGPAETGAGR